MRNTIKAALCGATILSALALAGTAQAQSDVAMTGNVGSWVLKATKTGTVPASERVIIAVHLKLRNADALRTLAASVSNPHSPSYGKYISPAVFRANYAPAAADVAAVKAFLTSAGLKIVDEAPSGIYVAAAGTVGQLRTALKINQDYFTVGSRTVRANSVAPALPASIAAVVQGISGLDEAADTKFPSYVRPHVGQLHAAARKTTSTVTPPPVAANLPGMFCDTYWNDMTTKVTPSAKPFPAKLPFEMCGYTPQQVQAAYGANKLKYDGHGVTVAIVDAYASPTMFADANAYAANHGLPPLTAANYREITPAGIYGVDPAEPCGPQGWWGEESLDVASVHGMAPGANIVYVGARNCAAPLTLSLFKTIDTSVANVITNSWSENGEFNSPDVTGAYDAAFMEAASLGISVLFSSGDDGDLVSKNGVVSGSSPATNPWVTSVGGTSLGLLGPKGTKVEYGWGTSRTSLVSPVVATDGSTITNSGNSGYSFYGGAGGGVSLVQPQPDYQASVVPAVLAGQTYTTPFISGYSETIVFGAPHRVTPDVAMVADPYTGYLVGESFTIAGDPVADYGCTPTSDTTEYCEVGFGGTSLASPLMAGVLARVNHARIAASMPSVGFANPLLYGVPSGAIGSSAPIGDVVAPTTPIAVMRTYMGNPNKARVVSINSTPTGPSLKYANLGFDSYFLYTSAGYDTVTGVGVPNVPALATAATMVVK